MCDWPQRIEIVVIGKEDRSVRVSQLPRLLPGIHSPLSDSAEDSRIAGIAHDSRRVKPGFVFVAISGTQRDGADFAADAIERGAVAVVAERRIALPRPAPLYVVQDARRALAALAAAFQGRPSRRIEVIGVTGTNGKTTTACMIRSILEAAGRPCGLLGTISYETGKRSLPASITTPESVDVQEFLADMWRSDMKYAAMEVSSHALCMRRVDFVQFAAGVFTNLAPEHLDYHGNMTAYREAKARLFRALGPAAHAVINADDPSGAAMARATFANVVRYGIRKQADVSAKVRETTIEGTRFRLRTARGGVDVAMPLIGLHNVYNALAAAAALLSLGLDLDAVRAGLETMPFVPGRLETIPNDRGYKVLVDYAHTDQALEAVLSSLRPLTHKRILVVFGAGGDRDRSKRPRMGRAVERGADLAWVTSDNPRSEEPGAIIAEILDGVQSRKRIRIQPDRQVAIEDAIRSARPGDLVLIAGKGHERTQRFKDTVVPFDDREAVRRAFGASLS